MGEPTFSLRALRERKLDAPDLDDECVLLNKSELLALVEAVEAARPVLDLCVAEGYLYPPYCLEVAILREALACFMEEGT